jgi:hypothetical protein
MVVCVRGIKTVTVTVAVKVTIVVEAGQRRAVKGFQY